MQLKPESSQYNKKEESLTYSPPKKKIVIFFKKNWRPIALLNTDYKIIAKLIANRIKTVLPLIINEDQTGYLKDR